MKKLVIITTLLLWGYLASAQQQVHLNEIISVANNYMAPTRQGHDAIDTIYCKVDSLSDTVLYQILYKDKSFVLLSGSKACLPILAYGETQSRIPIWNDAHDTPEGLMNLVNQYEVHVRHCFSSDTITLAFQSEWRSLISNTKSSTSIVVPNLLTSKWGQTKSNDNEDEDAYNYFIEQPANCSHKAPTGCVAVALAQVLNYWKYPVYYTQGSNQFDWCNMVDMLLQSSPNYENERNAIAWMMKKCGDMVDMDYQCNGSSASVQLLPSVLETMGYEIEESGIFEPTTSHLYWVTEWENKIKESLDGGKPIIYSAVSVIFTDNTNFHYGAGHAFVMDGYDSDHKFHINWGWNGDCDGYYYLGDMQIDDTTFYNINHVAIFGIKPSSSDYDFCDFDLDLADHYHQYYTELDLDELEPWENVPQTAQNLTSPSFCDNSAEDWRVIPTGEQSSYLAHKSVELLPGFHAQKGSEFVAKIVPCPNCDNRGMELSDGNDVSENDAGYDDSAKGEKGAMFEDKDMESVFKDGERLFPNPSKDRITYRGKEVNRVFVYDMAGKPVFRWFVVSKTDNEVTIDIKNIEVGTYLLYVVNNDSSRSAYKFVKK